MSSVYIAERNAYYHARDRCRDARHPNFKYYGGRGIEFRFASFQEFFAELGKRPKGRVLDRINNDGHYEKGNMRWVSRQISRKNRRKFLRVWQTGFFAWNTGRTKIMDRTKVTQVVIYVDDKFMRKIRREAGERRRKLGPTVFEILREYFEAKGAINVGTSTR
jgi:hypothetical protein